MRLADLVAATTDVAATRARTEKIERLAALVGDTDQDEVAIVFGLIAGQPRQGRIGVGWATVGAIVPAPATSSSLSIASLDELLTAISDTRGAGSRADRELLLHEFLRRATEAEADFVRRLLLGELRQGANTGVAIEALARASGQASSSVRRAVMLTGDLGLVAEIALRQGQPGLDAVGLELLRPVHPMLASTAKSVGEALAELGRSSVEWKLDGVRVQVHRHGREVRIWTRNLNEITTTLPSVVEVVLGLSGNRLVLDGEVLGIDDSGRPLAFQDTVRASSSVAPFFFDILHRDGIDLLDLPLESRLAELEATVGDLKVPGITTSDTSEGEAMLSDALERGHEGVVIKAAASRYQAGRRGKAWRKVKPVHTLDLVVLAVEEGSGRRHGWLSNIHLGARDPEGGFVMVGKTFKGMTDAMLDWQTTRFRELEIETRSRVVQVRPEQVVEIALDGIQRSTRYPGGVTLRFARVVRYRDDKSAHEADTIAAVRALGR